MRIQRDFLLTTEFTGPWYPGFLADRDGAAGKASGGVSALTGWLETLLGVAPPAFHPAVRMMVAERSLESYLQSSPAAFFARSFKNDPEGVALKLLQWRDTLVMSGWDGAPGGLPARIKTAMEALRFQKCDAETPGLPDRVIGVIERLKRCSPGVLDTVYLLRDAEQEPLLVQALLAALESTGTRVTRWPGPEPPEQKGDLKQARTKIEDGRPFTPRGDMTVVRLLGASPYESAEMLAAWLAAHGTQGVVLIADNARRAEIDAALRRYGCAAVGSSGSSPHRSALQLLGLAIGLRWAPLDPERLLDLLQLPVSPIPRRVGMRLAEVVANSPGIGGEEWTAQLERCLEAAEDDGDAVAGVGAPNARRANKAKSGGPADRRKDSPADRGAGRRADLEKRLDTWLPDPTRLLDPGAPMPADAVQDFCTSAFDWARRRFEALRRDPAPRTSGEVRLRGDEVNLLGAVMRQADTLGKLVRASGLASLPPVQLMRLLEQATGEGLSVSMSEPEAGSVHMVSSPAAILAPARTIVWWNFSGSAGARAADVLFPATEVRALERLGIRVPHPGVLACRQALEWRRPLRMARERLVLVTQEASEGEEEENHPLWDELRSGWRKLDAARITLNIRQLLDLRKGPMAAPSTALPRLAFPVPRRTWTLPSLPPGLRKVESATSLEALLACPLKYVLHYPARLLPAEPLALKDTWLVEGSFAHAIIEEIFAPGRKTPDPAAIAAEVDRLFEKRVSEQAATLLSRSRRLDRFRLLRNITSAAVTLAAFLRDHGLRIRGVEEEFEQDTEIGKVCGRIDLRAADARGRNMVLDLKLSGYGVSSYIRKITKGQAVQLAVYSRLVGKRCPAAYVSLSDGQIVTPRDNPVPGANAVTGPSLADTWDAMTISVASVLDTQLKAKRALATGVDGPREDDAGIPAVDGGLTTLEPPCDFCDYAALCRTGE